jgi:hypothetical protein
VFRREKIRPWYRKGKEKFHEAEHGDSMPHLGLRATEELQRQEHQTNEDSILDDRKGRVRCPCASPRVDELDHDFSPPTRVGAVQFPSATRSLHLQ